MIIIGGGGGSGMDLGMDMDLGMGMYSRWEICGGWESRKGVFSGREGVVGGDY